MTALLETFSRHYDPLYLGMGRRALANALHVTLGQSFPRPGGGYNLYRGSGSAQQIDWDHPVGVAGKDAAAVSNFADCPHDINLVYYYALRAVSPGGVEQDSREEITRLAFDVEGQAILPPVEPPSDLQVEPLAGGRFRLSWYYRASKPVQSPGEFRVYTNNGSGVVDYDSLVAAVSFRFWRWHYEYVSEFFDSGTATLWSVRTVNRAEQEERNTNTVSAAADAAGPPPNSGAWVC